MVIGTGKGAASCAPPTPPPEAPDVRAVREKVARKIARLRAGDKAATDFDHFCVAYGMVAGTTSLGAGQTFSTGLVRAEDWAPLGIVMSRSRARRGHRCGYLRAEFVSGRTYEVFADEDPAGPTSILHDSNLLGWWVVPEFTCDGLFAMPLRRELFLASGQRLGVLESATLMSGCAVLELDPEGTTLLPMRTRSAGLICGNPLKEVMKLTPFGRGLGPRAPALDTVITPHAGALGPDELDLFFGAALSVRAMLCLTVPSSD